ncbi:hypothetical protein HIM_05205 [Hirsutella minnesotensis 3608]|uniref:Uncharacterized protein n=1 Tax=Hirsutella minnesotensis 3608 TaxID=1043627 RepID=A0A0F8A5G3_9HYPO|nr:hypothetical protein HIM_05205 [Hirsutella minnesotensis 3608]
MATEHESNLEQQQTSKSPPQNASTRQIDNNQRRNNPGEQTDQSLHPENLQNRVRASGWIPLHGFQGIVPFRAGDWTSYRRAVRRLLSFPDHMDETKSEYIDSLKRSHVKNHDGAELSLLPYTLLHYQPGYAQPSVHDDDLAFTEEGRPAVSQIFTWLALTAGNARESVFFVKLRSEEAPAYQHLRPSIKQLGADVRLISHRSENAESNKPPSIAYVAFPKSFGLGGTGARSWDAAQYTISIKTAVEVLFGRVYPRPAHHGLFELEKADGTVSSFGSHGLLTMRPSELDEVYSNVPQPGQQRLPTIDVRFTTPANRRIPLLISGFHLPSDEDLSIGFTHEELVKGCMEGSPDLFRVLEKIQALAKKFMTMSGIKDQTQNEGYRECEWLHIVAADAGSRPTELFVSKSPSMKIPLTDGATTEWGAEAMRNLARFELEFLLITPEFHKDESSILLEGYPRGPTVPLPELGSTVDDFIDRISELVQRCSAKSSSRCAMFFTSFDPAIDKVSIEPVLPRETSRYIETRTLFVTPDTTDEEWFSIRAQIPTRSIRIAIIHATQRDWQGCKARSNVWGPRYGLVEHPKWTCPGDRIANDDDTGEGPPIGPRNSQVNRARRKEVRRRAGTGAGAYIASKCPWCDELRFEEWPGKRRRKHLVARHRDKLLSTLGILGATIRHKNGDSLAPIPLKMPKHVFAAQQAGVNIGGNEQGRNFCDRCGRDLLRFSNMAEVLYHDRNCVPGIYHGASSSFCSECGDYRWESKQDAELSEVALPASQPCGHSSDDGRRYCMHCGFDQDSLKAEELLLHRSLCRGYGAQPGRFCPECGMQFWKGNALADWKFNARHSKVCHGRSQETERGEVADSLQQSDTGPQHGGENIETVLYEEAAQSLNSLLRVPEQDVSMSATVPTEQPKEKSDKKRQWLKDENSDSRDTPVAESSPLEEMEIQRNVKRRKAGTSLAIEKGAIDNLEVDNHENEEPKVLPFEGKQHANKKEGKLAQAEAEAESKVKDKIAAKADSNSALAAKASSSKRKATESDEGTSEAAKEAAEPKLKRSRKTSDPKQPTQPVRRSARNAKKAK